MGKLLISFLKFLDNNIVPSRPKQTEGARLITRNWCSEQSTPVLAVYSS